MNDDFIYQHAVCLTTNIGMGFPTWQLAGTYSDKLFD